MLLDHFLITDVNETNCYLIACLETLQGVLIDAGGFDREVVEIVRDRHISVATILITHNHYDHTGGLLDYLRAFRSARVYCGSRWIGQGVEAESLSDGRRLNLGSLDCQALALGGHTLDSFAFHFTRSDDFFQDVSGDNALPPQVSILFSGDVLFAGSIGGVANDEARFEELDSIHRKILTLPDSTVIYPGHGPATTVAIERNYNPFLRG